MKRLQSPDVWMAIWVEGSIQSPETWDALNDLHSIYMLYHVFDFGCSSISFLTHSGQLQLQFIIDFPVNEMVSAGRLPSFKAFRPVSSIPEFAKVIHEKMPNNKKQLHPTSVVSDVVVFPSLKVFTNSRFEFFHVKLHPFIIRCPSIWRLETLEVAELNRFTLDFGWFHRRLSASPSAKDTNLFWRGKSLWTKERDEGVSPKFSSCLPLPVIIWAWNFPQVAVKILPGPIFFVENPPHLFGVLII